MAGPYYVNDDGSDTTPFDTYAKAKPTLVGLLGDGTITIAAGEEIHIGHDHVDQDGGSVIVAFGNGTEEQPIRLISTNTATDVYQPGARLESVGGGSDITIQSGASVWYGVTLISLDNFSVGTANATHKFYDCTIDALDIPASIVSEATAEFHNCTLTSNDITVASIICGSEAAALFLDCTIVLANAGSGEPIVAVSDGARAIFESCDFSGCTSDMSLSEVGVINNSQIIYRRCKLPSAYTVESAFGGNNVLQVESCSGTTSTVPFLGVGGDAGVSGLIDVFGITKTVTAQKRVGGASDGVNDYSWEMTAEATVSYFSPLESPPIVYWAEPGAQTVTIHTADDADLNDNELWMVVEHPDGSVTNAEPTHTVLANTRPDPLAAPGAVARDSGSTWDGAGTGTDGSTGQQKLVSSSFNPTVAGPVIIRIYLAKASAVMYVDPKPVVT